MKPGISSCYFDMLDAYEMAKTFVECGYDQTEINEEHYNAFIGKRMSVLIVAILMNWDSSFPRDIWSI